MSMKEIIGEWIGKLVFASCKKAFEDFYSYKVRSDMNKSLSNIARLIVDAKKDELSMQSMNFLMDMNIHPDDFNKYAKAQHKQRKILRDQEIKA